MDDPCKLLFDKIPTYLALQTKRLGHVRSRIGEQCKENIQRKEVFIMTQMGLDYLKLKETGRHNVADENIRTQANEISSREADTHAYTASFEPRRVAASEKQAESSSRQASVAERKQTLDEKYREREVKASEGQAAARQAQASAAQKQADIKELENARHEITDYLGYMPKTAAQALSTYMQKERLVSGAQTVKQGARDSVIDFAKSLARLGLGLTSDIDPAQYIKVWGQATWNQIKSILSGPAPQILK